MDEQMGKTDYENYIKSLPLKSIQIGGCRRMIRLDESACKAFLLDNDGNWTGKVATLPKSVTTEDVADLGAGDAGDIGSNSDGDEERIKPKIYKNEKGKQKTTSAPLTPQKKKKQRISMFSLFSKMDKKKRTLFLLISLSIIILIVLSILSISSLGNDEDAQSQPFTSNLPAQKDPSVSDGNYCILIASRDILPGEKLEEDDISTLYISQVEYSVFSTQSCLCLSENKDDIIGFYALSFIPKGGAIVDVSFSSPIDASSPWSAVDESHAALLIPVASDINLFPVLVIGNHEKIVIKRSTIDSNYKPGKTVETDGIDHQTAVAQATITDTFTIEKAVIADLIDVNGNSIYAAYEQLLELPPAFCKSTVRQLLNAENISNFIPYYVKIIVTQEQKDAIGELSHETTVSEFSPWQYNDGRTSCEDVSYQTEFMTVNSLVFDYINKMGEKEELS